jgi:hypothetical protein
MSEMGGAVTKRQLAGSLGGFFVDAANRYGNDVSPKKPSSSWQSCLITFPPQNPTQVGYPSIHPPSLTPNLRQANPAQKLTIARPSSQKKYEMEDITTHTYSRRY